MAKYLPSRESGEEDVEFLQTFPFKLVCHKQTSIFEPKFSCLKKLSSRNGLFYANTREL